MLLAGTSRTWQGGSDFLACSFGSALGSSALGIATNSGVGGPVGGDSDEGLATAIRRSPDTCGTESVDKEGTLSSVVGEKLSSGIIVVGNSATNVVSSSSSTGNNEGRDSFRSNAS